MRIQILLGVHVQRSTTFESRTRKKTMMMKMMKFSCFRDGDDHDELDLDKTLFFVRPTVFFEKKRFWQTKLNPNEVR